METLEARRKWNLFRTLKNKFFNSEFYIQQKLFYTNEGEIHSQIKIRQLITYQPAIKERLKEVLKVSNTRGTLGSSGKKEEQHNWINIKDYF